MFSREIHISGSMKRGRNTAPRETEKGQSTTLDRTHKSSGREGTLRSMGRRRGHINVSYMSRETANVDKNAFRRDWDRVPRPSGSACSNRSRVAPIANTLAPRGPGRAASNVKSSRMRAPPWLTSTSNRCAIIQRKVSWMMRLDVASHSDFRFDTQKSLSAQDESLNNPRLKCRSDVALLILA